MLAVVERYRPLPRGLTGCAPRPRRRAARPARRTPARLGLGGAARLARLPSRADGAPGLASRAVANERSSFYRRVLEQLLEDGILRRDMSVLVVAGGPADRDAFHSLGFEQVTISNVDESVAAEAARSVRVELPGRGERSTIRTAASTSTVVSAGLHHCRSPHRALLELYRVARVAALALESRDSALMRVAVKLGAVDEYELAAVAAHGLRSGGVANTSTPNYVYRWSEREVEKTVASFAPHARHRIRFFREFELPEALVEIDRGARATRPAPGAARRDAGSPACCRRQANLFAFAIEKPQLPADLQPWMRVEDGELASRPGGRRAPVRDATNEPRAPPAGLGAPGGGRRALGGADAAGTQGRPLGRGRVLRHRRSRDRARLLGRRHARAPARRERGARLRLRRRPAHARPVHPLRPRDRRRHLGRDGRSGAAPERGLRRLRVPGQRRLRPGELETASFDFVYSSIALQHIPTVRGDRAAT